MLKRMLFAVLVAGSMLLTSAPAREAACQQDPDRKKPCPLQKRCMSNADCRMIECGLQCQLNDDAYDRTSRVCR